MRELTLEENKKIQLELFTFFHEFCEKNNLKYAMCYGTLLGAVRHHGYIPWDDDIDVIMPREDYEKFRTLLNNTRYKVFDCRFNKNYYLPFPKLCDLSTYKRENIYLKNDPELGVDIDIFPVEKFDSVDNILNIRKKIRKVFPKFILSMAPLNDKNIFKRLLKRIFQVPFKAKSNKFANQIYKLSLPVKHNGDKFFAIASGPNVARTNPNEIFDFDPFNERLLLQFEDKKFWAPSKYDVILSIIYGDYMKLPPIEKQVTHHSYKVYLK